MNLYDDRGALKLTLGEFTRRFTAQCHKRCGFTHFDDGASVSEYCVEVARSYYEEPDYREEGPEACADSDMDYWGEE